MTTAREIMTDFAVTLTEEQTIVEAARLLADLDIGSVPVVGADDLLVGVLTDRDIVLRVLARGDDAGTTRVGDALSGRPVVVQPDDDVEDVLRMMGEHRVRRVPVAESGRVIGMIALADVARTLPTRRVGDLLGIISEPEAEAEPPQEPEAQRGSEGANDEAASPMPALQAAADSAILEPVSEVIDLRDEAAESRDVVDVILERHAQIKQAFTDVMDVVGDERQRRFDELVRLLAVHEAVEEELIHPLAQDRIQDGDETVGARLAEEAQAKRALARLHDLGVEHPDFEDGLMNLAVDVLAHAEAEERDELPALREAVPAAQLQALSRLWTAAEALAPTRPHPRVGEIGLANLVAGPPLMVFDRIRDAIRAANRP
ncbi:MAG TPA: CBS domain-containing protein [Candidatus Nanopelagicales bacterium]